MEIFTKQDLENAFAAGFNSGSVFNGVGINKIDSEFFFDFNDYYTFKHGNKLDKIIPERDTFDPKQVPPEYY